MRGGGGGGGGGRGKNGCEGERRGEGERRMGLGSCLIKKLKYFKHTVHKYYVVCVSQATYEEVAKCVSLCFSEDHQISCSFLHEVASVDRQSVAAHVTPLPSHTSPRPNHL